MSAAAHDDDASGHAGAVAHHLTDDHGDDDLGHAEATLGPIDLGAWGAGILGVLVGVVMAACFALATGG